MTTHPSIRRKGFTLIELLTVLSINILFLAILLIALGGAREQARRVQCAGHLQQMGLALALYADEYHDCIPQTANHLDPNSQENWHRNALLMKTLGLASNRRERSVITCPSHANPGRNIAGFLEDNEMDVWISYGMNVAFGSCRTDAHQRRKRLEFKQPSRVMAFMDAYAYGNAVGEVDWQSCLSPCDAYRHGDCAQVQFLDQHVGKTPQLVHSCSEEDIDFAFWGCYWLVP